MKKGLPLNTYAQLTMMIFFMIPTIGQAASLKDFENACTARLKKNKNGEKICHCIANNLEQKKTSSAQLDLLVENYKAKGTASKDIDADVLIDFEAQVAEECQKNHLYKIKVEPSETEAPQ